MKELKAIILCNNPIALFALKEYLFFDRVVGVCIPKKNKEMYHILQPLLQEKGVELLRVTRTDYVDLLGNLIREKQPDVALLMTFPFILPEELLAIPPKGFINFHYGLLPQCRGPHPILRHMINHDSYGGITVHKIDKGVDTGDIILQEKIPIEVNDTYGTLQGKLAYQGARMADNLYRILSYGNIIPARKQDESKAQYFEMPNAAELTINWQTMNAEKIVRTINACNPWNKGAGSSLENWFVGITEAEIVGETDSMEVPGTLLSLDRIEGLTVKTLDNKKLRINIIYTNEGFFSGWRLLDFGIKPGHIFS